MSSLGDHAEKMRIVPVRRQDVEICDGRPRAQRRGRVDKKYFPHGSLESNIQRFASNNELPRR